jgi:hypothetical protein
LGVLEGLAIQVDPQARIVSKSYPYVASRVLTDPQAELQEAFRRLAFTSSGSVRWGRLESLLDEAKDARGYDASAALDVLTDYLLTDSGDSLLQDLAQQIVEAADSLGTDSLAYIFEASRALAINDEVAAVRAFRSLEEIFQAGSGQNGLLGAKTKLGEDLREILPEPTPNMLRTGKVLRLLGGQNGPGDLTNFVPVIRKLAQEPRVQRTASEIVAKLGERFLSRSLRSVFGLPPPVFGVGSGRIASVVSESVKG